MKTQQKRATIYLEASLHKALRLKAAETERTISEIVSRAVQHSLAEDAEDLAAFETRAREPNLPFERILKDLKKRGLL
ncbi:MAG: CopG family transcriptional regulator [Acidobacteria bacterium]|nr:CopG family transcriptional regulator [Acidobacteriota bacterium]